MCIESLHCFSDIDAVLAGIKDLMQEPNGNLIVADIFEKKDIEKYEQKFKEYFNIEKKEVITFNVKHAMDLDKQRVEKIVNQVSNS